MMKIKKMKKRRERNLPRSVLEREDVGGTLQAGSWSAFSSSSSSSSSLFTIEYVESFLLRLKFPYFSKYPSISRNPQIPLFTLRHSSKCICTCFT